MPNYLQENLIISGFIKINFFFVFAIQKPYLFNSNNDFFSLLSHDINLYISLLLMSINEKVIT